ncbi:hypothetical protein Q8A67_011313 [Cirrhinus molitorella]|uniref:DUF4585 domain-containing protein n=1 Tax=Cirrhinus molitorella TaxID=172907 RepID=A0AA88TM15_9TELE|nr:hypothetical protein Q8A67_011313 [Cirrhinus molitorella]
MSSLEKRHTGQRGSMQGHRKYSDGLSDTSSSGSCMDDTDREVSNLTDRAFRSLCIGEEAIYNDSEFSSSPTERHKAFAEETQQKTISHEAFSYNFQQYGEAEVQSEMASTFQHSYVDVTHQEQAFGEGSLSYLNNGSKEVTWQQSRSTSRVSSLIKAFSSGECYHDSGTCDVILARDRYRDFGSESWDKSAMLSIQRELSEVSSGYHQNFKSGPFQSYRNHFYTSDVATAVAQMDTTVLMKSKSKFKALNSTNCFFHSEFSPFQLWEEYNRYSFQSTNVSGFMSVSEFPRWYDSPMYKELKDNQRIPNSPCESRRFNQRQIQDVVASQRSRSTVVQKASAIEKRCESEMASNCPPWKKNNNFVRNKLPGNRPSTVSPTNEKTCRPDSNLFSSNKVTQDIVVESNLPSSATPFNITQLLTPVIHTRQETETSEILQYAHTPSVSDYSSQGETDPKLQTDVKHLRDSYKSKASSLLFNLKDNRKRVKSTYSPTRFKGLEITDRNKQPSKLEGRESRFSDIFVSQETAQENLIGTDARASCNLIRESSTALITPKDYTDGFGSYDNLTLTSPQIQDRVTNYKTLLGSSEGHSPRTDALANTELSTHNLSTQDKSSLTSEGQLKDLNGTFIHARPEIANVFPKAYLPTHSLPAQTSERYSQSDNNVKEDEKGGEKRSQEKLQVEFDTSNETINRMKMVLKDGAATHVNNYRDKVSSIGEDVCTAVKQGQASSEVPKIHLEDIKVSTEEVSSNKEFMAGHKNQHEVIKKENLNGKKGAVVTELVGEKDFSEQKNLKALAVQNKPKTVNNMKEHIEMPRKNTYDVGKEITPLKKDSPSKLEKTEINPRQGAAETQDIKVYGNKQHPLKSDIRKKDNPILSMSGQNYGDLKVNENRSSLREKKERNVEATEKKQADQTNTKQYQPETKGSARQEQEHAQLSQQDTKKESILSKPEATQKNKKVTRPEISAIADYARLRVIAAEDDTKDLDIFPKLDFYNSYDQPVLRIHKDLQGNVSDIGGESKRGVISVEKGQNLEEKTSQFKKQTDKETLPQQQNYLIPSTVQQKPVSLVASGSQDEAASMGTQPWALTNHKESNTKPTFMEYPTRGERNKMYQSKNPQGVPLQAQGTISRSRQMTHDKTRQASLANLSTSGTVKAVGNQVNVASPPEEEMEELQYYTVNALDTRIKPKEAPEPPLPSLKMSQNTDSETEKKDDFLQSLTDYGKASGPRSNSSSPAMGKPIMFRVKDNTTRTSSVTKTVKPRFHKSFSEDFRIGSPKEHLSGSEKEDEIQPKESTNPSILHEPAIAAQRLQKFKETLHNNLSSAEYATKQLKSYRRRSQNFDEEETRSVISTVSEDMENFTASLRDVANISAAFMTKHESYRDAYQRPASACYERPESACYDRPESACSDMRPFGRPPAVPPKSEKALRRAQRLTTRRMKKTETPKTAPENQEPPESKSIRNVSGVPSSPSDMLSTHLAVQASPPLSQYDVQPNYTPPAHSIVAQPFPVTQRKLLQDPNSGQYFMVDVPLPVKTKTFYDPETGKYVQLNVRQRSQDALTQPASLEMLNTPYMLYRGFLPMAASSLPPLRSSSEMSTPADNQDTLERGSEAWRQNVYSQNSNRDSQQYPDAPYRSHEQIHNPSENGINNNERHTDIITMSELEDFAMEST